VKPALAIITVSLALLSARANCDDKKPLTFEITMRGEIDDKAATDAGFRTTYFPYAHLAFTNLRASDGEAAAIHRGYFKTADDARRYFDWNLDKRAGKIIARGDKPRSDGKPVERRAEYLLKSDKESRTWVVTWTDAEVVTIVYAPTLECALEIEKQSSN
jgi:hypothetical protein